METLRTSVSFALKNVVTSSLTVFLLLAFSQIVAAQNTQANRRVSSVLAESRPRRVTAELQASIVPTNVGSPELEASMGIERRVFQLVNETRVKYGLTVLAWDDELCRLARMHSQNMGRGSYFSHEDRGLGPKERAVQAGIKPFRTIAENIAYNWGYEDPGAFAVERWMVSSGHRENILGKQYKASAIGVFVKPNGAVYITQVFVSR